MTVIDLQSPVSPPLQHEINAIETQRDHLFSQLDLAKSVDAFLATYQHSLSCQEIRAHLPRTTEKLNILDLGFGGGESSLFLAQLGHHVHAVEPSPLNCELLSHAAHKFQLPITTYKGTSEGIDDLDRDDFDICLFNSSLHHCDDPKKALYNCFSKLRPGGKVLLINEPILKFYRSQQWFQKKLLSDPVSLGHYGGNEHIYSYHGYKRMLYAAGARSVKSYFAQQNFYPRERIFRDMSKRIQDQYVYSNGKILLKFIILLGLQNVLTHQHNPLAFMMKHLSLLPVSFEASADI